MIYFADASQEPVVLALVAIVGTVITALFKLLNDNTNALKKVAHSSESVAKATTKSAAEAKQRNGHLGDQNIQIAKLVTSGNKDVASIKVSNEKIANVLSKSAIIAAEDRDILTAPAQHIDNQVVEHQHVLDKDTKSK